jgi:tRNA threonylcarbamoyladenosine modification (KEOPS) complex Cgi121 subunit
MRVLRMEAEKAAAALLRDDEGALVVGTGAVRSLEELQLAHYLAERSLEKKTNVANKLKFEFLLWLTGKTDIRSAIAAAAPETGGNALVVVFSGRGTDALVKKLEALGAVDAHLDKDAQPLALERISLSRLK